MSKRRAARFVVFGAIAGATGIAGLVQGCGGGNNNNNNTSSSTGTGTGTGSGSTTGTGSGTGTGTGSASTTGTGSGTGTGTGSASTTGTGSGTGTGTSTSTSTSSACTTTLTALEAEFPVPDGGVPDAGDAGADAEADAGDAGDAGDAAVTTVSPALLFSFDNGEISNSTYPGNWGFGSSGSGLAVSTQGFTCPGSISGVFNGTGYSALVYTFGPAANWTGYQTLHLAVKVTSADPTTLTFAHAFIQSNNYGSGYNRAGTNISSTQLQTGDWIPTSVDLTPASVDGGTGNFDPAIVNQIGVQAGASNPDSATPPPITILIDDVWIE